MKAGSEWFVRALVIAVTGAALASLPPISTASASPTTFSGPDGRIAFVSDRSGTALEIYSMKPDGSDVVQLTHSPDGTANFNPDWSPDGRLIAFDSTMNQQDGFPDVYVMAADGSNLRQLTHVPQDESEWSGGPAFSPDGRHIAFDRCFSDGCGVWIMRSNGSHQRPLTGHTANGNFDPQFSPDGSMIVFSRHPHGEPTFRQAVYTMTVKGGQVHRITPWSLQAGAPDWSPDGTRIIFPSNRIPAHSQLFTVRPDGTDLQPLTDPPSANNDGEATFAPLGDFITWMSDRGHHAGEWDVWVMRADGTHFRDITPDDPAQDIQPDWGPKAIP